MPNRSQEIADRAPGSGEDRAAAGDQERPLCRGDELDGGRQRRGIGGRARNRHRPRIGRNLPDAQPNVTGKLDVDRPGWPLVAIWTARRITQGMFSGSSTVMAHLVIEESMATWSVS